MAIDFVPLDQSPKPASDGIDFVPMDQPAQPAGQPSNAGIQGVADSISVVMNKINNPGQQPPANAVDLSPGGQGLFNKAGGAVSSYLGQKFPNSPYLDAVPGTAVAMANPQNWTGTATPGEVGLPGQDAAANQAQVAAAKTLGFTKRFLNKPGAIDKAKQIGQTMLDQGVIKNPLTSPFSSGPEPMMDRAEQLAETSGQNIGNTIDNLSQSGQKSFDTNDVIQKIQDQLMPKYQGGAYDQQAKIANEIIDTVKAHGNGPIDFKSAQDLKQKLFDLSNFNSQSEGVKADMYRRASGIVKDSLDNSVESATQSNPQVLAQYLADKKNYGGSIEAQKALTNRLSSEQGNKRVGLTDTIAAVPEIAHGNFGAAAALLGIKHALESRGNAAYASLMNDYANSGININAIRALINAKQSGQQQ